LTHSADYKGNIESGTLLIDIATRNVICLTPDDSVGGAARVMAEMHISSVVVTDAAGHPLGIVTERTILQAMHSGGNPATSLKHFMSSPVTTVPESLTCLDAYQKCLREGVRHLLIVDKDGKLLGVVGEMDFRQNINLATLAGRRRIDSVMSRLVFSLPSQASLLDALNLMQTHRDTCVVVVEGDRPVGIITERDIVRLYSRSPERTDISLGKVMTSPVLTIPLDNTINEAAERMLMDCVRHLVVVDRLGKVAGLLGEHELTHAMTLGLIDDKLIAEGAFLHTLINTIPDLIWLKDVDGIYRACNPRFERFFGAREKDIVGKSDYDFVDKELADSFREYDRKAMESEGTSVNEEWVTFADDGHRELLETFKSPMHDTAGNLIGVLGIARDITERKRAELQLIESELQYRTLADSGQALIWTAGKDNLCEYFNKVWLEFTGRSLEQELGNGWAEGVHPDDLQDCVAVYVDKFDRREKFGMDYRLRRHDGEYRWIRDEGCPRYNNQGEFIGYIGYCLDITERKEAEECLLVTASVFESSQEAILITDANNKIIEVNPAFTLITGYSREEVLGRNPKLLNSGRQDNDFYAAMWCSLTQKKAWRGEIWNRRKTGEIYAELLSISVICDNEGRVRRHVAVFSDISYLKEHENELSRIANFDALTGVPNRRLLADRLRQAIARAQRSGRMLAVCYIDLDGFKQVNDLHGHGVGDQLLVNITSRLQEALRAGDTLARLGGDEFAVLFNDLVREQECLQVLDRILDIIAKPIMIGSNKILVSASIGVTFYPSDNEDGDTLLRHADQAMYVAKQTGKNRYHLYDAEHDQRVRSLHESRRRIQQGLERGEFELFYQPKIMLASGNVIGVEALIRWNHLERGLLLPAEFLPFIEDSALDIQLGEWVMDTALAQIDAWYREGLVLEVSINISAHHLQSPDFVEKLARRLARYPELPRDKLQIEVLETAALADIDQSAETIESCRALGVNFALDDFGTGYSSLAYLRKLSTETLKIDQSFVRGMLTNEGDRAIVQGIIALAKTFGRKTVAEGMETTELIQVLVEVGCMYGQGYGIAYPMPSEDFQAWLRVRN
jgi:diguanylate cyclase (GGDEF)-like protein/PAS domain S-box-containing protein